MDDDNTAQYCFQDRNSSCKKASISITFYVTVYIFLSLISAVTVFLNVLVIISISHVKQLHSPTNMLILSLAVSDLLVGLFVIPANTVAIMESCWVSSQYLCPLLLYITYLCSTSSLGNLVLISIDRYVAVCDPLSYHSKITIRRCMCCISISWCCCIEYDAVLITLYLNIRMPSGCFEECYLSEGLFWVAVSDFFISMVVPCSIIIALYFKIFLVARSQARQVFSKRAVNVSGVKTVQASKSEMKATKTLGIIIFTYLLFWNPVIVLFCTLLNFSSASFIMCFLPVMNSFLNPLIYAFFYPSFKMTAKKVLGMK